nr:D-glycero-beta-D-manno-heptose-7-phosphate kinase [uncultured Rhodoblastus sp.]
MNASWISKWRGAKIFVLGDVMLDKFVYGQVERISPEAPVPVMHFQSEKLMLGGAANVARNIAALGGEAILVGAVGDDEQGDQVAGPLVCDDGVVGRFVRLPGHPTTTKVRYVSGGHQIMRLDIERRAALGPDHHDTICGWLNESLEEISALVLSDYAKGVLDPRLARRVIDAARARRLPVIVDTKSLDLAPYAGATVITPNAREAAAIAGVQCVDDQQAEIAVKILLDRAKVESVVLTRGAQGMSIYDPADPEGAIAHVPTRALEVFDVSGAGDTVVAALALSLCAGASIRTSANIGNAAAGIAVGKRGTAAIGARELATALGGVREGDPKIVENDVAAEVVADWRAQRLKVGFTNGCFDLLHPGHVDLLKRARASCDRLVVALNADASVRRLKGETRPVQNEHARSAVMAAIDSVDLVTLFDEDTPLRLIQLLKPDFLIKGADYTVAAVVGADFVASYGGRVVLVPINEGHSTTSIIARSSAKARDFPAHAFGE